MFTDFAFKVCLVGRPGVGKTTLARLIAKRFEEMECTVGLPQESARAFIEEHGRAPEDVSEQYLLMRSQARNEFRADQDGGDLVICDSSTFMNYVYALKVYLENGKLEDEVMLPGFLHETLDHLKTYNAIFFLDGDYVPLEEDSGRAHTDPEELVEIHRMIEAFLELYVDDWHYVVCNIHDDAENTRDVLVTAIMALITERANELYEQHLGEEREVA